MPAWAGELEGTLGGSVEDIVTERWDTLMGFVLGTTSVNDRAAAQDVIQDSIVKLLAKEVEVPDDPEKAWNALLNTIRNVARNHHRTEEVRRADPLASIDFDPATITGAGFATDLVWKICYGIELREQLTRAMECLTDSEREVVKLRYGKELTNAEVAEQRGCSTSAVRKLISKALAKMRVELDGRFGPE